MSRLTSFVALCGMASAQTDSPISACTASHPHADLATVCPPGTPSDSQGGRYGDCCTKLSQIASSGCFCDNSFMSGGGGVDSTRMTELRDGSYDVCGVESFELNTCYDDREGYLVAYGPLLVGRALTCPDLLDLGLTCETDLGVLSPLVPAGSLMKGFCPRHCEMCTPVVGTGSRPTCGAPPVTTNCVGWRSTNDCDGTPNATRDTANDHDCLWVGPGGQSGYCECEGVHGTPTRYGARGCMPNAPSALVSLTIPNCASICAAAATQTAPPTIYYIPYNTQPPRKASASEPATDAGVGDDASMPTNTKLIVFAAFVVGCMVFAAVGCFFKKKTWKPATKLKWELEEEAEAAARDQPGDTKPDAEQGEQKS